MSIISEELLLKDNPQRFSVLPIVHHDIWAMYKQAEASIWHASELEFSKDVSDWKKLSADERHFLTYVIAFFASSDGIVNENLACRYMRLVQLPEARCFYGFQIAIENIHAETYGRMIDTFITNEGEKENLFNAIRTIPCIQKKAEWALKYIKNTAPLMASNAEGVIVENANTEFTEKDFITGLVAFAAVEGIFFSGSFCAIYYLKDKGGCMPELCKANDFIARDEGLHTQFACLLYSKVNNKLSEKEVHDLIKEAYEIECEFITNALPCQLLGMDAHQMREYIKFVSNRLAVSLGYSKIWQDTIQPFAFMDRILLSNKSNFFESRPTEYQKAVEYNKDEDDGFGFVNNL